MSSVWIFARTETIRFKLQIFIQCVLKKGPLLRNPINTNYTIGYLSV